LNKKSRDKGPVVGCWTSQNGTKNDIGALGGDRRKPVWTIGGKRKGKKGGVN